MSLADHVGTPDVCPSCLPLPVDFGARQESIWLHALSQFVDQSGVDVSGMSRTDLALLVRSWARSNTVARMERTLSDEAPVRPMVHRFEPRSYRVAASLFFAVLVCLLLVCAGVWRFLS